MDLKIICRYKENQLQLSVCNKYQYLDNQNDTKPSKPHLQYKEQDLQKEGDYNTIVNLAMC